jgi:hypothetical protein
MNHPCGSCLCWSECNGVAWGTPECHNWPQPQDKTNQKAVPAYLDDRTESGLLEDD